MASASSAIVVMGVTGAGKTTVGRRLAAELNYEFRDGDDFHSAESIAKMHRGEPLTDEDRMPWLICLRDLMEQSLDRGAGIVIACSALRAAYRDVLMLRDPTLRQRSWIIYLRVTPDIARQRLKERSSHFMPASLVDSQFETLEEPKDAIVLDAAQSLEEIVAEAVRALSQASSQSSQATGVRGY